MTKSDPRKGEMVIEREFNAPVEQVWAVHTEAAHLARWWGPKGFTMEVIKMDLNAGGDLHYSLENKEEGFKMWGLVNYEEIAPPYRLVFVSSFADDAATIARHPMSETWPKKIRNILSLKAKGNKTLLTLKSYPIESTEPEILTYTSAFENVNTGIAETFEKLDEYLADFGRK